MQTDNPTPYRLLLIDGLNIVRRVYGALQQEDSPEKAQGALRSSMGSIRRALTEHKPTHVLIAFDYGGHTFRHDLLPEYKANRKPMPEVLKEALPDFYLQLWEQLGTKVLSVPGVEAEDVLKTASRRWDIPKRGPVVALSTDKDVAALAAEGVLVRNHFKPEWHDEEWCLRTWGVPTRLLLDSLALQGDEVDGVPGVEKVGPKTAAKLIMEYGDLESVLANADKVKGVVGERLRASLDKVRLARQLVELKSDVQLNITWNDCRLQQAEFA